MSGEFNVSQGRPGFDWDKALSEFKQSSISDQVTTPILTTELSLSGINRGRVMRIVASSLAALTLLGMAFKPNDTSERTSAEYTEAESLEPVKDLSTPVIVDDAEQEDEIITTTTIKQTTATTSAAPLETIPRTSNLEDTEIVVVGDAECEADTKKALSLLEREAPRYFELVENNIGIIQCVDQGSGMHASEQYPRFEVGDATRFAGDEWYASTIVHDAVHSELYNQYQLENPGMLVPKDVWIGSDAEQICLNVQLDVLKEIDAPSKFISHLKKAHDTKYWEISIDNRGW